MASENIDDRIKAALKKAPIFRGLTAKQVSNILNVPEPTGRWHLEILQARGDLKHHKVGRAKLYFLQKEKNEQ